MALMMLYYELACAESFSGKWWVRATFEPLPQNLGILFLFDQIEPGMLKLISLKKISG